MQKEQDPVLCSKRYSVKSRSVKEVSADKIREANGQKLAIVLRKFRRVDLLILSGIL